MKCLCWMLMALWGQNPEVTVERLKGAPTEGVFEQISPSQITVGGQKVPLNDVIEIRIKSAASVPAPAATAPVEVILNDGSRLTGTQITAKGTQFTLESTELGTVAIRKNVVRSMRLGARDSALDESWQKILERDSKKELIVIRKDDKLDFLPGVSGEIDAENIKFLVDNEEVPVKRERVYGLVFQPPAPAGKPAASLELLNDQQLQVRQIALKGELLQVSLHAGIAVNVPLKQLKAIDYSLGKIVQLSSMKPTSVQFTPFFEDVPGYYDFQRNNGPLRTPIVIGGQVFAKGLCIHSRTRLAYRLQGEYRRFQATVGIDDQSDDTGLRGDVHLRVSGDDKVLFEGDFKGADDPRKIDLDVSSVRELQILVDYGGDLDIADWLSLGDAKVVK